MKKVIYKNRYGDEIKFIQISPKIIHMSGCSYLRYGFSNNYDEAYLKYLKDQQGIDDNPLFFEEFKNIIHGKNWHDPNKNPLYQYLKLVKSDFKTVNMVDPSGGPYIELGTDLTKFWGEGKPRIVEK